VDSVLAEAIPITMNTMTIMGTTIITTTITKATVTMIITIM
jgi:hypothetical protein